MPSQVVAGDVTAQLRGCGTRPMETSIIGSPTLVRSLLDERLIDRLSLMVFPLVVESGRGLLRRSDDSAGLDLVHADTLPNGVLHLAHEPAARGRCLTPRAGRRCDVRTRHVAPNPWRVRGGGGHVPHRRQMDRRAAASTACTLVPCGGGGGSGDGGTNGTTDTSTNGTTDTSTGTTDDTTSSTRPSTTATTIEVSA